MDASGPGRNGAGGGVDPSGGGAGDGASGSAASSLATDGDVYAGIAPGADGLAGAEPALDAADWAGDTSADVAGDSASAVEAGGRRDETDVPGEGEGGRKPAADERGLAPN
jgi:hypothetical protein